MLLSWESIPGPVLSNWEQLETFADTLILLPKALSVELALSLHLYPDRQPNTRPFGILWKENVLYEGIRESDFSILSESSEPRYTYLSNRDYNRICLREMLL